MELPATKQLESALGHSFQRRELLAQALTHSSYAHESTEDDGSGDNEVLEFLGDAIVGMVTSEALFRNFHGRREGELSKVRAHLVSARHLAQVAKQLSLGEYLRLGRGEEKSGGRSKAALLVDALEAVVAALYLDAGLEAARQFILHKIVDPGLEELAQDAGKFAVTDYKSALQERLQSIAGLQPAYRVAHESGPDHRKVFTVELQIRLSSRGAAPDFIAHGEGSSKKVAEQRAARQALEHLQSLHPAPASSGGRP
jgi:ribonuclease-3